MAACAKFMEEARSSYTPAMHPDMVKLVYELAEGKRRATADEYKAVLGFAVQHAGKTATAVPEYAPACPYCASDNEAIKDTYYDQNCAGCVARMGAK